MKKYAVMEIIEEVESFIKEMNKKHPGRDADATVYVMIDKTGGYNTEVTIFHNSREGDVYYTGSGFRTFVSDIDDLKREQNSLRRMYCRAYCEWKKDKRRGGKRL